MQRTYTSWVTICINENNPSSVERMFKPITSTRFLALDKIIFPLLTSFHWHMLVLSIKDRRFHHYSFLRGYMSDAIDFRVKLMTSIPDECNMDISSCHEVESVDVPQQRGSLDCGVFLMSYMFSLVSGQAISIDQKDCARHRARIVSLFLSEGYKQSPQAHFLGC
ncbi:ubiquitin-like-specific protease 1A isoform X1 [Asparagus officinalis]|uniref:ubiquitin-like-specific protease 1A isoform X1 n=1 Tax=Asparagus officinalis TaxID=4686 RepID=UPI00098E45AC|nr:ubiquitin-like-specific protease 1A isoform X1 [Asparagus officinalis]XP_020269934.1 ubiquitin-like-specific protease 1A isoform X1 [Asparagus officinalis]XP_020269935.1 ubiquitin-like-specific protease 1A isoform X1 [Asparagus officinalis]